MSDEAHTHMQLWGGVESTVNRVQDQYFEQLQRSGHDNRISDLDLFAWLGITALRQPVLWERVAPGRLDRADWGWSDRWLSRLRDLKIRPIVGLLHHGSGPRHTNLLAPDFPEKFAEYARAVARRYPWVCDYTPVNEPLTTARFSALYGLWYPHARDDRSFVRALLNECKAVVLAMRAIREVNPSARLVQTDDLGKTFSTPPLRYQAEFENERRWLTFDLLCGLVKRGHSLWSCLADVGAPSEQLAWLADNPMPPDVLGFNYYLSSERYLDHELAHFPSSLHGGNGRDRYVDVEAARLRIHGIQGAGTLLREAWERFRLPMAITECHNGCTREEQLRWFAEVWADCLELRNDGVDVRAVTAWSLLGAFDWNSLVTRKEDHYEPGVFDIRAPKPRATAIAKLANRLAKGENSEHPLLAVSGWWHRPDRHLHGVALTDAGRRFRAGTPFTITNRFTKSNIRPVLITGGTGTLGRAFARACVVRGIPYRLTQRSEIDIADPVSVAAQFDTLDPWAVINTAGYVRVDDAETDIARCVRENAEGPTILANECRRRDLQFVTFSSDLVFDGKKRTAYVESDATCPLNVYGKSKARAELSVLETLRSALVIRTSAFFGPWDEHNFVTIALRELANGRRFVAAADAYVSPTYVPDLVEHTLDLLIDEECGIWHLANIGSTSWYELALRAAEFAGVSTRELVACETEEMHLPARRPPHSALSSEKAWIMPSLDSALQRYVTVRAPIPELESEAA